MHVHVLLLVFWLTVLIIFQAWKHFVETEKAFDPILLSAIDETHDIISDKDEMEKIEAKIMDALKRDVSTHLYTL